MTSEKANFQMLTKKHVLIVEGHRVWRDVLHDAIPADEFDVQLAQTYDEAMNALRVQRFDLAVVDPVLEGPPSPGQEVPDGNDGLRLLARLISRFPHTHLIILSGSVGREMLRNSLELPPELPVIQRQEWDKRRFLQTVSHLLAEDAADTAHISHTAADRWGPPEPHIEGQIATSDITTSDRETPPTPIHERYEG